MPTPNLKQLVAIATLLKPLLDELVFVGGSVTSLLISDDAAGEPRTTLDVDAIAEITSYAEYTAFGGRLRELGFVEDAREGAPLCRWVQHGATLDVMPLANEILGFSNRWYPLAMETAIKYRLSADLEIRLVTPRVFLATKLEAFRGRGKRDFSSSHDLEDLIYVIDGRASIVEEAKAGPEALADYLRREIASLLETSSFIDALPGYLLPDPASQGRLNLILKRLRLLASL